MLSLHSIPNITNQTNKSSLSESTPSQNARIFPRECLSRIGASLKDSLTAPRIPTFKQRKAWLVPLAIAGVAATGLAAYFAHKHFTLSVPTQPQSPADFTSNKILTGHPVPAPTSAPILSSRITMLPTEAPDKKSVTRNSTFPKMKSLTTTSGNKCHKITGLLSISTTILGGAIVASLIAWCCLDKCRRIKSQPIPDRQQPNRIKSQPIPDPQQPNIEDAQSLSIELESYLWDAVREKQFLEDWHLPTVLGLSPLTHALKLAIAELILGPNPMFAFQKQDKGIQLDQSQDLRFLYLDILHDVMNMQIDAAEHILELDELIRNLEAITIEQPLQDLALTMRAILATKIQGQLGSASEPLGITYGKALNTARSKQENQQRDRELSAPLFTSTRRQIMSNSAAPLSAASDTNVQLPFPVPPSTPQYLVRLPHSALTASPSVSPLSSPAASEGSDGHPHDSDADLEASDVWG